MRSSSTCEPGRASWWAARRVSHAICGRARVARPLVVSPVDDVRPVMMHAFYCDEHRTALAAAQSIVIVGSLRSTCVVLTFPTAPEAAPFPFPFASHLISRVLLLLPIPNSVKKRLLASKKLIADDQVCRFCIDDGEALLGTLSSPLANDQRGDVLSRCVLLFGYCTVALKLSAKMMREGAAQGVSYGERPALCMVTRVQVTCGAPQGRDGVCRVDRPRECCDSLLQPPPASPTHCVVKCISNGKAGCYLKRDMSEQRWHNALPQRLLRER